LDDSAVRRATTNRSAGIAACNEKAQPVEDGMTNRLLRIGLAFLAGLALAALPSLGHDRNDGLGQDRDRHKVKFDRGDRDDEDFDRDDDHARLGRVVIFPRVRRVHGEDDDEFDREDHDGHLGRIVVFPHIRGSYGRPPGWDRGRKVGWGHCDVPPGLAKKEGCHHIFGRHGRPHRNHRPVIVFEP